MGKIIIGLILFTIIFGIIFIAFVPIFEEQIIKRIGITISWITFFESLILWYNFNNDYGGMQFTFTINWIPQLNMVAQFGIDGISLFFILLTTLLIPLVLITTWDNKIPKIKEYIICFLFLELFLICVFTVLDLFLFYIFFESVLIPMYLIITIWGSRERKIRAGYLLVLYTVFGSLFFLMAILSILDTCGSTNYFDLILKEIPFEMQKIYFLAFFLAFAVKVPILPFHIWLPEAHVEAPTGGSVVLAGILLKLGTYGILRFLLPILPLASIYYTPLVFTMCSLAVIYTSLTAIRQGDMKRIIAYASVAHMNLVVLGLFSITQQGLEGGILQSIAHGFVSSGLFFSIGVVYDRYHTRLLKYLGGLTIVMPIYSIILLFFTLANIAFPGTGNFVGEFLILFGIFKVNPEIGFISSLNIILCGTYSLWMFNRLMFGQLKTQYVKGKFTDIKRHELVVLLILVLLTFLMGVYPDFFLRSISASVELLMQIIENKTK